LPISTGPILVIGPEIYKKSQIYRNETSSLRRELLKSRP
jgi:hypothetical protein